MNLFVQPLNGVIKFCVVTELSIELHMLIMTIQDLAKLNMLAPSTLRTTMSAIRMTSDCPRHKRSAPKQVRH